MAKKMSKVSIIDHLFDKCKIKYSYDNFLDNNNQIFYTSHTTMLEGVDFDLTFNPLTHLGYKSIIKSLGPIYANNFTPTFSSIIISIPSKLSLANIEELWMGISKALEDHSIEKTYLDLLPSNNLLTISISIQAKQERNIFVQKPKCLSGDLICINSSLGAAFIASQILQREKRVFTESNAQPQLDKYKNIIRHYLNPAIDKELFNILKETGITCSYGIFNKDGLADSIKTLCNNNGVGAKIFANRIPISQETNEIAQELNIDSLTAAFNGGDDYNFVLTFPLSQSQRVIKELPQLDIIGHTCDIENGVKLISPDGSELDLKAQAWDN